MESLFAAALILQGVVDAYANPLHVYTSTPLNLRFPLVFNIFNLPNTNLRLVRSVSSMVPLEGEQLTGAKSPPRDCRHILAYVPQPSGRPLVGLDVHVFECWK